jgi:hypothetical protein
MKGRSKKAILEVMGSMIHDVGEEESDSSQALERLERMLQEAQEWTRVEMRQK